MASFLNRANSLQIIDPVLTNLARRYQAHGFIADQLAPAIPVSTLSGQYPTFDKAFWFSNDTDNKVKDRSPAKEVDFTWSTDTYLAQEYALKVSFTDLELQQANAPGAANGAIRLEQSKNDFLSLRMAISRELRWATALSDPAQTTGGQLTSGNSTAISTKWDTSTSNPEADIRAAALSIYSAIGYEPNTIVIPYPVAYNLATVHGTDTFRNQFLYTVNGQQMIDLGVGVLPAEIHGMKVLIPKGPQYTTNNEGAASPTYSEIWGKDVRLLYVDPNAAWGTPSVAYRITHTAPTVFRWREVDPDVNYIRQMERVQEKVVAPDAGWVLRAAIS